MTVLRAAFPDTALALFVGVSLKAAVQVRDAKLDDAGSIAVLIGELGYPAPQDEVETRLHRLRGIDSAIVRVAVVNGDVAGLVTCHVFFSIHSTAPVAWLTTLVVAQQSFGLGIGRALTASAEEWARGKGAIRISVTSGAQRDAAHAFYEHIGYERTGVRLTKNLKRSPAAT